MLEGIQPNEQKEEQKSENEVAREAMKQETTFAGFFAYMEKAGYPKKIGNEVGFSNLPQRLFGAEGYMLGMALKNIPKETAQKWAFHTREECAQLLAGHKFPEVIIESALNEQDWRNSIQTKILNEKFPEYQIGDESVLQTLKTERTKEMLFTCAKYLVDELKVDFNKIW